MPGLKPFGCGVLKSVNQQIREKKATVSQLDVKFLIGVLALNPGQWGSSSHFTPESTSSLRKHRQRCGTSTLKLIGIHPSKRGNIFAKSSSQTCIVRARRYGAV
ncbi:hypothetical protein EYR41_004601 [Orbilia oligospora]|uniref:Uncharacterized protein n=1 Tax=Orbilia oligospora TaxID=2813651 RepID=A0A7C8PLZ5_ORBOL|nr:hypothetical protein TWF751_005267 [Orbilia oligospora]TGJ72728.1 hypothetical protein EYR41_004601 [Orbilia oligospora]